MTGEDAYRWLMNAASGSAYNLFDMHVVASIFAISIQEMEADHRPLGDGTGLGPAEIAAVVGDMFPARASDIAAMTQGLSPVIDEEEQSVRDILLMYADGDPRLALPMAAMVARRCKSPHHLWQDLGLRNRGELSQLMNRNFGALARRNTNDMKWKRFLYRMVCGAEGFTLCTAPVCTDCDDFEHCFGAEDGEARLARMRNDRTAAAAE